MSSKYERKPSQEPTPSESAAIHDFAASRGFRVGRISVQGNHWYYWLRGHFRLSNIASIYVVSAQSADGTPHQIHVAFDPIFKSKQLRVLVEKRAP